MNASAILTAQGWRGVGHSLHKTDDSIGLAKPILLNRKSNTKGLGTKPHFTSDQWWMNAFDEQLKNLETSEDGKITQVITTGKLNAIEKGSLSKYSLYTSFVRGGLLEGTSARTELEGADDNDGCMTAATDETKDGKSSRKKESRKKEKQEKKEKAARRAAKNNEGVLQDAVARKESKEERRARRAERRELKESVSSEDKAERQRRKEERRACQAKRRREKANVKRRAKLDKMSKRQSGKAVKRT
ncbi:hypothetical protein AAL_05502 [Moelleriella libera RCEF 2490]|uniref:DNA-directed RNA polymerase II subunit RPB1 n=1 Tax=Moelleriella libera RCEF 2490 TaxID=1081109 RepID=A0A168AD99_9HYPO|nr:hypothetical protein AAL_05502 [Moelleriella libera RCEF 2490]